MLFPSLGLVAEGLLIALMLLIVQMLKAARLELEARMRDRAREELRVRVALENTDALLDEIKGGRDDEKPSKLPE
jgi:hypothetical protein